MGHERSTETQPPSSLGAQANLGYGGRAVTVGSQASQSEWASAVRTALASPQHWLLQESIDAPPEELAFLIGDGVELRMAKADYGAFMIGRQLVGAARRNSTTATDPALTNLSRGGGLGPVFFDPN